MLVLATLTAGCAAAGNSGPTGFPAITQSPAISPLPEETISPTEEPCIPSGDQTAIQQALVSPGSVAILCPNSVFDLKETIQFTAEGQEISTLGLPRDDSRALLRVADKNVVVAIHSGNNAEVMLRNVIIDGNRPEFGTGTGALIEWSAAASGHTVEWVKAYEPRGWSVLYMGEGDDHKCSGAVARYNELGPAGQAEYGMADGISLACRNSIVEYNTIVDATDGGIVIFQATGSLIANNTIRTENRIMFYGISMEDYGPFNGDFTGTRVIGNTIDAHGALIRRGIAMGPHVGCIPEEEAFLRSRGANVSDNVLQGDFMGYGFVVSGVEDWTVSGNIDRSNHLEPTRESDCFGNPVDAPAGFQINAATSSGQFQEQFRDSVLGFTVEWWPAMPVFSEPCLKDLLGTDLVEEVKNGRLGPLMPALESPESGELISRCVSVYQAPDIPNPQVEIMVGLHACEPYCAQVSLFNLSSTQAAALGSAEFLLEGFLVPCIGLPEFIQPQEEVLCVIEDYVTDGFQVLWWNGFAPGGGGWGFNYPFEGD